MKLNKENEKYALHFIFHTKILGVHIKSSRIPVMENNVSITYQVMGRPKITQNIIHVYLSKRLYSNRLIISLNKCATTEYQMIIYETIHIPTRGE